MRSWIIKIKIPSLTWFPKEGVIPAAPKLCLIDQIAQFLHVRTCSTVRNNVSASDHGHNLRHPCFLTIDSFKDLSFSPPFPLC